MAVPRKKPPTTCAKRSTGGPTSSRKQTSSSNSCACFHLAPHTAGIQRIVRFQSSHQPVLYHRISDRFSGLQGVISHPCCNFVAEKRDQCCGQTHASVKILTANMRIGRNAADAARGQCSYPIDQELQRGEKIKCNQRLHCIELELPGFGGHADCDIISHHLER